MPNDAKLGLAVGVTVVIAVAVVYARRDSAAIPEPAATIGRSEETMPPARSAQKPAAGRTIAHSSQRHHVVEAGDTLFGLAQHYYGDGSRFTDLYQANREQLSNPDNLPPGVELLIPDLPVTP